MEGTGRMTVAVAAAETVETVDITTKIVRVARTVKADQEAG